MKTIIGLLLLILAVLVFGAPLVCGGAVLAGAGVVSILASPLFWVVFLVGAGLTVAGAVAKHLADNPREYVDPLGQDETPGEVARREAIAAVREAAEERERYRDCPSCAERILRKAVVCKHCGRDVPAED